MRSHGIPHQGYWPSANIAFLLIVSLLIAATQIGCSDSLPASHPASTGYLLGYDAGGIVLVELEKGTRRYILPNAAGYSYTYPVWSAERNALYCIANRAKVILAKAGQTGSDVLYVAPGGYEISDLALVEDQLLVTCDKEYEPAADSKLMLVDLDHRISTCLYSGNLTRQPIQKGGPGEILLSRRTKVDGQWRDVIVTYDLETGTSDDIAVLSDTMRFRVSPDGKTVVGVTHAGAFKIGQLPGLELEPLEVEDMPGRTGAGWPFCFLDEAHVLVWRRRSSMWSVGTYVIDLATGETARVCDVGPWAMSYIPDIAERPK